MHPPWVCLGAVAALGFLIAPKRPTPLNADLAIPAEVAKTCAGDVNSTPPGGRGWVDSLVATVVSVALREATAYLGQSAGRLLGLTNPPRTNDHDSNGTS